jgi:hypothetical protein
MSDVTSDPGRAFLDSDEDSADPLRRRLTRKGADGRTYEVLAARRGIMMRYDAGGTGGGGGDTIAGAILGFVLELLANLVFTAILRCTAEHRQWKVKVYRLRGPFPRRIHSEVLPPGVEPEARTGELLERYAPIPTP